MPTPNPHPPDPEKILDLYFLETRAKLLEIAANLDRLDRAGGISPSDPRVTFIQKSLATLQGPGPGRVEKIQRLYSKE